MHRVTMFCILTAGLWSATSVAQVRILETAEDAEVRIHASPSEERLNVIPEPALSVPPEPLRPVHLLVMHHGTPDDTLTQRVEGWGEHVPLALALSQIIPQGWTVDDSAFRQFDRGTPTTWSGEGALWAEVLNKLANQHEFRATVDWNQRQILLGPVAESFRLPIPPARQWTLRSTETLRENIERWAQEAGWASVVWEAVNYPVVAPVMFKGEFDAQDGPLAMVARAFETSEQPLRFDLSTWDKVVHVTNKGYRPSRVNPSTPHELIPEVFPQAPSPERPAPPARTRQN